MLLVEAQVQENRCAASTKAFKKTRRKPPRRSSGEAQDFAYNPRAWWKRKRKEGTNMVTLTVDTHQFVVRLKKAGIQEKEAEAIAEVVRDAQASADLATKQDLSVVEARLEARMAETKAELVKWVVSVGVLQTAMIGALLLKLIPN
jgi:glycine/serine hydroxymethyltransferase